MNKLIRCMGLIALIMAYPLNANETDSNDWDMKFTPYLWALGLDGDTGVGTLDADLDIGFDELIENLNFVFMGHLAATRDDWTFYIDGLFSNLSSDGFDTKKVGPFNIGRFTVGPFRASLETEIKLTMNMIEVGAQYRVGEWPFGTSGRTWSLDLLGGGRYTILKTDLNFRASGSGKLGLSRSGTASLEEDWIDPYIGTQVQMNITPKWDLLLHGDFGGFGVGSDFTWNAFGIFSYAWREDKRLILGYRGLYQDYESGSGANRFDWDMTYYGPVAAIEFAF